MVDRAIEIDRNDLPKLKSLYQSNDHKRATAYMTIDNYIRWFDQDPHIKHIRFFCLNGDFSDGTFVVTDREKAFADTIDESHCKLIRLLELIDYSKGYEFMNVRAEIAPAVKKALQNVNVEVIEEVKTLLHYLPKEEALTFDVQPPKGVKLQQVLDFDHLDRVNNLWRYRDSNSMIFFQRISKYNPSVGAFNDDGVLMAWIFQYPTGFLGILQTEETYFGQGYGALVTRYLSKIVAKSGCDPFTDILETNQPSCRLFSKCGFEVVGKTHWILTKISWTPDDDKMNE